MIIEYRKLKVLREERKLFFVNIEKTLHLSCMWKAC